MTLSWVLYVFNCNVLCIGTTPGNNTKKFHLFCIRTFCYGDT